MHSAYDGDIVTHDSKRILEIQSEFYEKLYTTNDSIYCRIDDTLPHKKISDQQKTMLDREITMEELQYAIKTTAKNKSPGDDGFNVNIYIVFFSRIKEILFEALKYGIKMKILHPSARRGVITLIPKIGRNTKFVKNMRPIILLNGDYKLLSKIFAERMKQVLPDIIDSQQTGFLKGRNIAENTRKIFDVIDYLSDMEMPGTMVSIDFFKSF